jgi:hypothetical protein
VHRRTKTVKVDVDGKDFQKALHTIFSNKKAEANQLFEGAGPGGLSEARPGRRGVK